jgi:uncharacterized protein YkwD
MIARRRTTSHLVLTIFTSFLLAVALVMGSAGSANATSSDEQGFFDATNSYRRANGLGDLQYDAAASQIARVWAQQMSNAATLSHNPSLVDQINAQVTTQWTRLGENVGFGPTVGDIQNAFINSAPHRANILGDYNRVGIGTVRDGSGRIWVTLDFLKGPDLANPGPPPPQDVSPALTPATTSWGSSRTDVFKRGDDGALWQKTWNGSNWTAWQSLGGILTSEPAATSWGTGNITVFVIGTDRGLWYRSFNNGSWGQWNGLGGILTSGVGAASWGANHIDVFGRGTDGGVWTQSFNGSGWSGWSSLGGIVLSAPEAASWSPGRIDVVALGTDKAMWHRWFVAGGWSGWESMGGLFTSGPGTASDAANHLSLFGRGTDGALWSRTFNGSAWGGWTSLGGILSSAPAAVSPASGQMFVFVRGSSSTIYQNSLSGSNWSGWVPIG